MGRNRFSQRRLCQKAAPRFHTHVALCIMYTGSGFRGLQLQTHCPTHHTVEGLLIQALTDLGLIKSIQRGKPHDNVHHLARACRTDRGVHAIRNVVTLFVPTNKLEWLGGERKLEQELNNRLPHSVQVGCVIRVTGNFVPRHCCNRRVYRYLIPVYALLTKCDSWETFIRTYSTVVQDVKSLIQNSRALCNDVEQHNVKPLELHQQYNENDEERLTEKYNTSESAAKRRIPHIDLNECVQTVYTQMHWLHEVQAAVIRCNDVLQEYIVGSHRFHNFSSTEGNKLESNSSASEQNDKLYNPNSDEAARMIYRCEIAPRVYFLDAHQHGASYEEYIDNTNILQTKTNEYNSSSSSSDGSNKKNNVTGTKLESDKAEETSSPSLLLHTSRSTVFDTNSLEEAPLSHLPFVIFQIEGGSFLFNMIRKIVGTLLAVYRSARKELFSDALSPSKRVITPLAPGAYLLLALSSYRGYDNYVYSCRRSSRGNINNNNNNNNHDSINKLTESCAEESHQQGEVERTHKCKLELEEEEELYKEDKQEKEHVENEHERKREEKEYRNENVIADPSLQRCNTKTQLQSFQEAWGAHVSAKFELFATSCIYNDIVDIDLNRLPSLEAMLLSRDEAHTIRRPQWRTVEDVHLQSMKEYSAITPEVVERVGQSKCSAMTLFLRLLRVHNWSIREVTLPENCKAMLELQNKKRRREEPDEVLNTVNNNDKMESQSSKGDLDSENNNSITACMTEDTCNYVDEDGWIYVAANEEDERRLRHTYHAKKYGKPWTWERSAELRKNDAKFSIIITDDNNNSNEEY